jgi:hypothetical protein
MKSRALGVIGRYLILRRPKTRPAMANGAHFV